MALKYLVSGFFVKLITGFDDIMVHIPVVSHITKTKHGRIAFASGIFLAITLAIIISFLFASVIKLIPYFKYILASLIFFLAFAIYFDLFLPKPKEKVRKELKKIKRISAKRFLKLLLTGFVVAFITIIDDTIVFSSLFLGQLSNIPFVIIGIYSATALELTAIIYFSKKVAKFKWKKQVTTIGLILLGILILLGVL